MKDDEVDSPKNVGKRLKWLREFYGLTQEEFADKLDMSIDHRRYNNWEVGHTLLPFKPAVRIIQVYGTSLDFLFLNRLRDLSPEMLASFSSK